MNTRYLVQVRGLHGAIRMENPEVPGGWVDHFRSDERREALAVARKLAAESGYAIRVRDWENGGKVVFRRP